MHTDSMSSPNLHAAISLALTDTQRESYAGGFLYVIKSLSRLSVIPVIIPSSESEDSEQEKSGRLQLQGGSVIISVSVCVCALSVLPELSR